MTIIRSRISAAFAGLIVGAGIALGVALPLTATPAAAVPALMAPAAHGWTVNTYICDPTGMHCTSTNS